MFENRVLRRIFGPKRDEVTREWRKLHIEEIYDLYCSPNIVRVIIDKNKMDGACMGERKGVHRVSVGKSEGKNHLGETGLHVRIFLKWIFRKWDMGVWTGSCWLMRGKVGGHL